MRTRNILKLYYIVGNSTLLTTQKSKPTSKNALGLKYLGQKRHTVYTDFQKPCGRCRLGASCFHSASSIASQHRFSFLQKQNATCSCSESRKRIIMVRRQRMERSNGVEENLGRWYVLENVPPAPQWRDEFDLLWSFSELVLISCSCST